MGDAAQKDIGPDKSLLLVDDDEPFLRRLAKAMEKRGLEVETAGSVAAGSAIATARPPAFAVVDLLNGILQLAVQNGSVCHDDHRVKDCLAVVMAQFGQVMSCPCNS